MLEGMHRRGTPLTRDNYIALTTIGTPPDEPWTAEDEDSLPEPLQDWDAFKRERQQRRE